MKVLIIDIKIFAIDVSRILSGVETVLLIVGKNLARTFYQFPPQFFFLDCFQIGLF